MRFHRPVERPCNPVRLPPAWAAGLPALDELDDEPQLGPVALLQTASRVTESALQSRHGVAGDPSDEVFKHPDCCAPFLAHLVLIRCRALADLLAAYPIAIRRGSDSHDDEIF
ncbi:MAG: hypothetical protein MUF54_03510 [Polyangiaceae bacterium]|jgi:hypothetical protein|nr:hypothetical protein [Polyangiaceae bacterium]